MSSCACCVFCATAKVDVVQTYTALHASSSNVMACFGNLIMFDAQNASIVWL